MILASAQIKGIVGDLKGNLNNHLKMIRLASKNKASLIVFPEMSLTGYCREEALEFAFTKNDSRLTILKEEATKNKMIIVVGAPIIIQNNMYIGSFIIKPNANIEIYTKQFLHDGEALFFKSSFNYNPIIKIENEIIQFAICADIDTEKHAVNASKNNCSMYISSIFFSKKGIEKGHKILANYAKKYKFSILMSNYNGKHWSTLAGGKSAFWNNKGKKINELSISKEGLLIAEKVTANWNIKSIEF